MTNWFIEGYFEHARSLQRIRLEPIPFTIGRTDEAHLVLESAGISRGHARFFVDQERLYVEDTGSTNGTYLNRERVREPEVVQDGDIVHFAEIECRVVAAGPGRGADRAERTRAIEPLLSSALPRGTREFQQLLEHGEVTAHFQPIVTPDGRSFGCEILGRGTHPDLPPGPGPLFAIAESLDLEVPFSELLRERGMALAAAAGLTTPCFFNIHPAEMRDLPRLVASLARFREQWPALESVLEVHETSAAELAQMRELRQRLDELGIGLAYDDFGAGQARMLEVAEVPPDYVKFDMALIHDLDRASDAHRSMVNMLVGFARELGIRTCAEGVAHEGEAEACRDFGFDLLQGFHFGRPAPIVTG